MGSDVIRRAESRDADAIVALVVAAGLPADGVREQAREFFVAELESSIVGCCGLECHGQDALLRSVAVAPEARGRGTGARLVERALADARERGLASVSLLTTTAAGYFPRFGFREVGRDAVPAAVRESEEFLSVCPASATVMISFLPRPAM